MKQTKKKTWFRATFRRISLALVSLFLLGSFLLSMFVVVPATVSAQGQQCLQQNEGKCAALAGCPSNQICMQVGMGSECQYKAGECGYNMFCGTIGNPSNGDTCGCAGASYTQMSGTTNYCCGYIANGSCVSSFQSNCGDQIRVTSKSGFDTTLQSTTGSHAITINYEFKTADVSPLSLRIQSSDISTNYTTAAVNSTVVSNNARRVTFNLTDPTLFEAIGEVGQTQQYFADLYAGGVKACRIGAYNVVNAEPTPAWSCDASNPGAYNKCGSSGGCSSNDQVCTDIGCLKVPGKCGYTLPPSCGDPGTLNQCGSAGGCSRSDFVCKDKDGCLAIAGTCGLPGAPPADSSSETPGETSPSDEGSLLDAIKGPTNKTFDALNPLNISAGLKGESTKSPYLRSFATPGGVVSRLLLFAFPIAGIILFLMIVWGGFEMVTGAANAKSMDAGKQRITAAVIGFILLFVSYWLMQLIELIFGLSIL